MKFIILLVIRFYRKCISPLFPPRCKYYPTCSAYALTAVERYGAVRGTALAVWRLLRCNPWSMGGIDHVPDHFTFRVNKKYDHFENIDPEDLSEHNIVDTDNREEYEN